MGGLDGIRMAEAAGLIRAQDQANIEVDKSDQLRINAFNRINNRKHELLAYIKKQKEQLSNLEDAETELMLLDDTDSFMFAIVDEFVRHGNIETFIHHSSDKTEELLEQLKEKSEE